MRERRALRWSFIWRLRLRSTAMWVIRWLSTSSLFFVGRVLFRFLLSRVMGGDLDKWACFCLVCGWTHAGEEPEFVSKQPFSAELGWSWLHSELVPSRHGVECWWCWGSLVSDLTGECISNMSWVMQLSSSRAWIRESNSVKWVIPQGFFWCCNLKSAWKFGSVKGENGGDSTLCNIWRNGILSSKLGVEKSACSSSDLWLSVLSNGP